MGISAVMTSAAVNMGVQAPLYASELHSFRHPPRRVELDQLLLVLRNLRSGYTAFYSCQHECGFTLEYFSHSKQNLRAQYICFPNGFCLFVCGPGNGYILKSEMPRMIILSLLSHGRQRTFKVSSKSDNRWLYRWLAGNSSCCTA